MFVLNFHGIGEPTRTLDDGEQDVWVSRGQFLEILDTIKSRNDVQLTFDDGNMTDVDEALPALTKRGLHAQFFVCAGRLGLAGFLNQSDVRDLLAAGMLIGSHGMDHVSWRSLSESEMQREIEQAKHTLEQVTQAPIDAAACPFGQYGRRSLQALRRHGFARVYTSDGGAASPRDWLVARNTVRRSDSVKSIERLLNGDNRSTPLTQRAKRLIKQWR